MTIFDSYAPIYVATGQGAYAEQQAIRVLAELDQRPQRVLDLACGAGAAAMVFAAAGCSVSGIDSAPAMLDLAQTTAAVRGLDIEWITADIRAQQWVLKAVPVYALPQFPQASQVPANARLATPAYNLVTCFGAGLNYLTGANDLDQVCAGVAELLQPGGWFVCDLNDAAAFALRDEGDRVVYENGDYLVYQRTAYDRQRELANVRVVWFVYADERWCRGEETHLQRAWRSESLIAALERSGLSLERQVIVPSETAGNELPRIVYWARRIQ